MEITEPRLRNLLSQKKSNLMTMRQLMLSNNVNALRQSKRCHDNINAKINEINNSLPVPYNPEQLKIYNVVADREDHTDFKETFETTFINPFKKCSVPPTPIPDLKPKIDTRLRVFVEPPETKIYPIPKKDYIFPYIPKNDKDYEQNYSQY